MLLHGVINLVPTQPHRVTAPFNFGITGSFKAQMKDYTQWYCNLTNDYYFKYDVLYPPVFDA